MASTNTNKIIEALAFEIGDNLYIALYMNNYGSLSVGPYSPDSAIS